MAPGTARRPRRAPPGSTPHARRAPESRPAAHLHVQPEAPGSLHPHPPQSSPGGPRTFAAGADTRELTAAAPSSQARLMTVVLAEGSCGGQDHQGRDYRRIGMTVWDPGTDPYLSPPLQAAHLALLRRCGQERPTTAGQVLFREGDRAVLAFSHLHLIAGLGWACWQEAGRRPSANVQGSLARRWPRRGRAA